MRQWLCFALIVTLLISLIPANGQFVNARVVNIKAVAVKTGEQPEGAVINITVTITPGTGKVFVSTTPYTEIDMQGSAQLAALTACDLLGIDFTKYDFFYEIKADAPIVGGPSAGAVMTIATIAGLKNLTLRKDVFMTGMIYPDGFIGPVGGIPYKLEAAAKAGAKIFLIPKGQRVVYVQEKVERKQGPFLIITTRMKPVDLVEYGKKLGVKVVEVSTIEQALWYYTGYTIEKPKPSFNISKYSNLLKILAINMKNRTLRLLGVVRQFTEPHKAIELIKEADRYYDEGYYYTATSKYFQAEIELREIYYRNTINSYDDLSKEFDNVSNEIDEMVKYLKSIKNLGVETFQIVGAAEERIAWAEEYLFDAKTSGDFNTALHYLALAKERIESAKVWLSLLKTIKEDVPINRDELKKRAEFYFREAESLIVYARSIGGYSNLINSAEETIDLARRQFDMGFYAGSAITCIDAITRASLSIEFIGVVGDEMLKAKLESAKKSAASALAEAERAVTPILPIAYYEFAETQNDIALAISYYKLSERLAKLILVVAKAYPERELVQVEYPPITPGKSYHTYHRMHQISNIEIPGFEAGIALAAIAIAIYLRKR